MKTLVVVGAGFSGVATVAHILRSGCNGMRIVLVNRTRAMARGLAYGTHSPLHLLNASVGKMSALDGVPDHFLKFCKSRQQPVDSNSFVTRDLYGSYLNEVLDEAERLNPTVPLQRLVAEVTHVQPDGLGAQLLLSDGTVLKADHVVLAFGNFPPADCFNLNKTLRLQHYQHDPWESPTPLPPHPRSAVLLLGAGLTAVDVALRLLQQGHRGPIHLLSRRGLLPIGHLLQPPQALHLVVMPGTAPQSPRQLMKWVREMVGEHARQEGDWRGVIDGLRPHIHKLWRGMDIAQQRQFLRHVQPWWDIHRHRIAPATFAQFQGHLNSKQLSLHAGRMSNVALLGAEVIVEFRRRDDQAMESVRVSKIINCTGPDTALHRVDDALVNALRAQKLISAAPCGFGLCVDGQLRVQRQDGQLVPWLSYVGPMLKAQYWEATAVPELRHFSARLAMRLVEELASVGGPARASRASKHNPARPLQN
ncbi:FAD/NAD(P)-binding protein [Pseudomonas amygdali]|uniref:FAD/NAD(P)-binding protein n=1 Tax=Pseudomonas amygdali TaxID=47877 RepID=UPI001FB5C87F|nr:FAD/NAD(P)-binding protein [Pseudomonas amygdali]